MPLSEALMVIQQEMEWLKQNERIQFFEPNGAQEKFISLVGDQNDMVGIFSAANGTGKTSLAVNLLGNLIFGSQNSFFNHAIFKDWKHPKRARYITDPKLVEEIGPFHSEIEKWWPKGRYESLKGGKNYFSQYKANGWVVDVMTYDQEVKQFEGSTLGLVICDEPPPQPIWNASISRLRLGGMILCLMTPLTHAAWFYDEVVPKHQESVIYASMEDNCKIHGKRGQLEHSVIEAMIREMPQDEVEARAYGKAMYLAGLIFKQFEPRVHVLKESLRVTSNMPVYQVVDPHSDKPFAVIWATPDLNGDLYIVDEWPNEDFYRMHNCQLNINDYRKIFQDKEAGWNIERRIIDRHFADVRSPINKRTLRDELREIGLEYAPSYVASEEVETGIASVRKYLAYDQSMPFTNLNKPKLFINPHCTNTIKSFQRWSRDPDNGKPRDEFKDFMDCVRYLVMANPKIENPVPKFTPVKRWG